MACGNPYEEAKKVGTLDAYETFIKENPDSRDVFSANMEIETLLVSKARETQAVADFDAYLSRFKDNPPTKATYDKMLGERKSAFWNKALDTNKYYVVCCNNLGGCAGSSGPNTINPNTDKIYGSAFPQVSVEDWVKSQKMLMDKLNIPYWEMVAGGSLGGMQALQWTIAYPDKVKRAGIFAAAPKSSTQNIAMNEVARESIRKDKNFYDGNYHDHDVIPKNGLKTARMLGHITYLSEEHMDNRFGRRFQDSESKMNKGIDFEIENYLQYKGDQFSESFDANSYILMTKAMDGYDPASKKNGNLTKAMEPIKAKLLIVGFETDWLFPAKRGKEIQAAAMNANILSSFVILPGNQGHDSFLFHTPEYEKILSNFIES